MKALDRPRYEAFAQALAAGLSIKAAAAQAGYHDDRYWSHRRAGLKVITDRVAFLVEAAIGGGSSDLAPIIDKLVALADRAGDLDSGAGMTAACHLLSEAARLKRLMGEGRLDRVPALDAPPQLSQAEWIAAYVPKA